MESSQHSPKNSTPITNSKAKGPKRSVEEYTRQTYKDRRRAKENQNRQETKEEEELSLAKLISRMGE